VYPTPSIVFTFGFTFEYFKKCGGASPLVLCHFFWQDVLDEDIHHASVLLGLGGCLGCFWDLISMFCTKTFLFVLCVIAFLKLLVLTCILRLTLI